MAGEKIVAGEKNSLKNEISKMLEKFLLTTNLPFFVAVFTYNLLKNNQYEIAVYSFYYFSTFIMLYYSTFQYFEGKEPTNKNVKSIPAKNPVTLPHGSFYTFFEDSEVAAAASLIKAEIKKSQFEGTASVKSIIENSKTVAINADEQFLLQLAEMKSENEKLKIVLEKLMASQNVV